MTRRTLAPPAASPRSSAWSSAWSSARFGVWALATALALGVGLAAGGCGDDGARSGGAVGDLGASPGDVGARDTGPQDGGDGAGGAVTVDGLGADDGVGADTAADVGPDLEPDLGGDVGTDVGTDVATDLDAELGPEADAPQGETGSGEDVTPGPGDSSGAGDAPDTAGDLDAEDAGGPEGDAADAPDGTQDEMGDGGQDAGEDVAPDGAQDAGPELPQVVCGDGVCDPTEDACGCPDDCGCGDGTCDHTETWLSCPDDCGSCGDGHCGPGEAPGEAPGGCPEDCGSCGDGTCDLAEDAATCPSDCGGCPTADSVCEDESCYPWYEATPGADVDPTYPLPCGEAGPSLTMDLTTLGEAKRLIALVSAPSFQGPDTALALYTDFSAMCTAAATGLSLEPDVCADATAPGGTLADQTQVLLSDVPRSRLRLVGYTQSNSSQPHTLLLQAFYAPGEPCVPGPSVRGCYAGLCVAACEGAATGRCPETKDCADGVDADGDGLTDEDACDGAPAVTHCPVAVDATVGETTVIGVTAQGPLEPSFPWTELVSAPAGSSGAVLPAVPQFGAEIKPDAEGIYVVRSIFSSPAGELVACDTKVTVGSYDCYDGVDNDGDGKTDEQGPICDDWSGVLCPDDTVVVGLGDVALMATGFGGLEGQSLTWRVSAGPPDASPQVTDDGAGAGTFSPDAPGAYTLRAEGVVPGTVNHFACETHVLVALYDCADGIDADRDGLTDEDAAQCAGAQAVSCSPSGALPVLQTATMDTHTSAEVGGPLGALWTLEEAPPAWYVTPATPPGAAQTCDDTGCTQPAALDLLMAGTYRVRYMTVDPAGHLVGCEQTLTTTIPDGLRVELTWNPDVPVPLDTSDVDLHLRHPSAPGWFDDAGALDCYYGTCIDSYPDWGADGDPTNDPHLDVDDTEGHGPENINIRTPDVGVEYRLGVHLFDADHTPLSTSTVRVFCGGALTAEFGPVTLPTSNPTAGEADLMFWEVATITFDASGGCTVVELGDLLTDVEAGY